MPNNLINGQSTAPGELKTERKAMNLSQTEYWKRLFCSQTGGVQYEKGRPLPGAVAELRRLRYQLGIDVSGINAGNASAVIAAISSTQV